MRTPGPWKVGESLFSQKALIKSIKDSTGKHFVGVNGDENAQDNAAFIVRACNAHDDLVAACKKTLADCENGAHAELPGETITMLQAAIKKAEEVEG